MPTNASLILLLIFTKAFETSLPCSAVPMSRKSTASRCPRDAPAGAIALPIEPSVKTTSTSTVGLPRESQTRLPLSFSI